jgi:hypothetical protein
LSHLTELAGVELGRLDEIVEFGGGYGCLCRIICRFGFRGRYVICDLPEFSALQRYFLNAAGVGRGISRNPEEEAGIVLISDPSLFRPLPSQTSRHNAFIALWSLSETDMDFRRKVVGAFGDFQYYLLAYQDRFGEVDNEQFFAEFTAAKGDYTWTLTRIPHIPGNSYLVGVRRPK